MNRAIYILLALMLISCSKNETGNFIFEKSWQNGRAHDALVLSDTSFLVAGQADGMPFLIMTNRSGSRIMEYESGKAGAFTSVVDDTSAYYAAGFSGGDILVERISKNGINDWSVIISTEAYASRSIIKKDITGSFIVTGSCDPDSVDASSFKMVLIDRNGNITDETEVSPGYNVAASDFCTGSSGNIYLALSKNTGSAKTMASVAGVSPDGNILWEEELYNNSKFAAASMAIDIYQDNLYVTGKTELSIEDNTLENSFLVEVDTYGNTGSKTYLENSNIGVDIVFDDFERVHLLNKNCFLVDIIGMLSDDDLTLFRTFEVCDPYQTGALAAAFDLTDDGNYLMCGSRSGKVYYSLRKGDESNNEPAPESR